MNGLSSPLPQRTVFFTGTPKRKHAEVSTDDEDNASDSSSSASDIGSRSNSPSRRSTEDVTLNSTMTTTAPARDGSSSPRARVAQRFRSLAIDEAAKTAAAAVAAAETEMLTTAITPPVRDPSVSDQPLGVDTSPMRRKRIRLRSGSYGRMLLPKERHGTPPPTSTASSPPRVIVDPLRASLTWQDDEITVYDPDDADDDGTGVNGIGFKPTPAIARARALKRRQQLAEYRKREEREARARRNLRRRSRVAAEAAAAEAAEAAAAAAAAAAASAEAQATETVIVEPAETGLPLQPASLALASATVSPPPSDMASAQTSPRRVRFLEPGPAAIHFLETESAMMLST